MFNEFGDAILECVVCGDVFDITDQFPFLGFAATIIKEVTCMRCGAGLLVSNEDGFPKVIQVSGGQVFITRTSNSSGPAISPFMPYFMVPPRPEPIEEIARRVEEHLKARRPVKRNKRRWKVIYKGKLKDARNPRATTTPRKTKKNI